MPTNLSAAVSSFKEALSDVVSFNLVEQHPTKIAEDLPKRGPLATFGYSFANLKGLLVKFFQKKLTYEEF